MTEECYLAVWEFQVKPDTTEEFERAYAPDGSWAQLFRRSAEYLGTELLRDRERAGRYMTLDRWTSRDAFRNFKQEYAAEYATLDRKCAILTESETPLGEFEPSRGLSAMD